MENLLYYPYINLPRTDWAIRTLLYYNHIGAIIPQDYFYQPEKYDDYMRQLIANELVIQISPLDILEKPREVIQPFIEYISGDDFKRKKRSSLSKYRNIKQSFNIEPDSPLIHRSKFDNDILYQLTQLGLAEKVNDEWYRVERRTAIDLMTFLASIVGEKIEYLPVTDLSIKKLPFTHDKMVYKTKKKVNVRREIIIKELIPFPEQIDLTKLRDFKDKNHELLNKFRNKVELIALNKNLDEGSDLFNETLKELNYRKDELAAKMNESRFGQLLFGTVCGVTGAVIGLQNAGTTGALVGTLAALPSFVNAIHSALKIERIDNITDQSGMKYLALMDSRLRRPGANMV